MAFYKIVLYRIFEFLGCGYGWPVWGRSGGVSSRFGCHHHLPLCASDLHRSHYIATINPPLLLLIALSLPSCSSSKAVEGSETSHKEVNFGIEHSVSSSKTEEKASDHHLNIVIEREYLPFTAPIIQKLGEIWSDQSKISTGTANYSQEIGKTTGNTCTETAKTYPETAKASTGATDNSANTPNLVHSLPIFGESPPTNAHFLPYSAVIREKITITSELTDTTRTAEATTNALQSHFDLSSDTCTTSIEETRRSAISSHDSKFGSFLAFLSSFWHFLLLVPVILFFIRYIAPFFRRSE